MAHGSKGWFQNVDPIGSHHTRNFRRWLLSVNWRLSVNCRLTFPGARKNAKWEILGYSSLYVPQCMLATFIIHMNVVSRFDSRGTSATNWPMGHILSPTFYDFLRRAANDAEYCREVNPKIRESNFDSPVAKFFVSWRFETYKRPNPLTRFL